MFLLWIVIGLVGGYLLARFLNITHPTPNQPPSIVDLNDVITGISKKVLTPIGLYQPPLDWYIAYIVFVFDHDKGWYYETFETKIGDKPTAFAAIKQFTLEHEKEEFFIVKVELITPIVTS